jgi:transcriptional regulator GlxA family with amidase domain
MDDATWDFQSLLEGHIEADRSARSRVRRLIGWILEDPARPYDVRHLADQAAVSPRTLSRIFARETGTTPAKFIERARIRLAGLLLEKSALPIGSIASRCGFRNGERMRRAFHRVLGACPRDASFRLRHDA